MSGEEVADGRLLLLLNESLIPGIEGELVLERLLLTAERTGLG